MIPSCLYPTLHIHALITSSKIYSKIPIPAGKGLKHPLYADGIRYMGFRLSRCFVAQQLGGGSTMLRECRSPVTRLLTHTNELELKIKLSLLLGADWSQYIQGILQPVRTSLLNLRHLCSSFTPLIHSQSTIPVTKHQQALLYALLISTPSTHPPCSLKSLL
jgi:hypothetical protein